MIKTEIRKMETLIRRLTIAIQRQSAPAPRKLQTARDIIDLLQEQVESLRAATQTDAVQRARALGYLAELARKTIETADLAARIESLERDANKQR